MMNLDAMPLADIEDSKLQQNSFYPELSTAEFLSLYVVPANFSSDTALLINKLQLAAVWVNKQLNEHRQEHWLNAAKLTDVDNTGIDEVNELELLYKTAVYAKAKSNLLLSKLSQSHRDKQDATRDMANDNEQYWLTESSNAIALMLGESEQLSVELI